MTYLDDSHPAQSSHESTADSHKPLTDDQISALKDFAINRLKRFDPQSCYYIPTKEVPRNVELLTTAGTTQEKDPVEFYRQWLEGVMSDTFPEKIDELVENFRKEGNWQLVPASTFGIVMTDENPNAVDDLSTLRVLCIPEDSELVLMRYTD